LKLTLETKIYLFKGFYYSKIFFYLYAIFFLMFINIICNDRLSYLSTVPPKNQADSVMGWHMHKTEMTRFHFNYHTSTANKRFQNIFFAIFFSYLILNIL